MTTIFTKGDVKRKFVTIIAKEWSDTSDLQSEIDKLEAEDCLIVDIKIIKSCEAGVGTILTQHMTQYMIEYLSPLYEVIATYRKLYDSLYDESIGVYTTLEDAEAAKRKHGGRTRIVTHSPRVIEFS